jgi:hypothetical protein
MKREVFELFYKIFGLSLLPLGTTGREYKVGGNNRLPRTTGGGEQLQEKVGVNPLYSNRCFGVNLSAYSNHFNDLLQCCGNTIPYI